MGRNMNLILESRVKRGDQVVWVASELTLEDHSLVVEDINVLSVRGTLKRKLEIVMADLVNGRGGFYRQIVGAISEKRKEEEPSG